MTALGRAVRAGVRRSRTQSVAIGLAALVATTCSVLGGSALDVFGTPVLALLGFGGVLIALLGALLPAVRAARARTIEALRVE